MVNKHTVFFHHFLKMAVAQWIRRVPTDANQNDVDWEAHYFGRQHRVSSLFSQSTQHRRASCLTVNATEPAKQGLLYRCCADHTDRSARAGVPEEAGATKEALAQWARKALCASAQVVSDGLACFTGVTTAGASHERTVTGGGAASVKLEQFRAVNTLLGNLKTSFSGTYHSFDFAKYGQCYRGRFNIASTGALICPPSLADCCAPLR